MAGGINRNQGKDLGSQTVSRQDRNTFLSDGGLWAWNAGTSFLTWSDTINVTVGGLGTFTIVAGVIGNIINTGDGIYIVLDRASAGVVTLTVLPLSSVTNDDDDRLYLGARGADDRFYVADGTVIGDGEVKSLGGLFGSSDRDTVAGSGAIGYTVPFDYIVGSNQLAVYVGPAAGGASLRLRAGIPTGDFYAEVGAVGDLSNTILTDAAFAAGGETITFYNVVGGQGPPGVSTLQGAYDGGQTVDTQVHGPEVIVNTVSPGWPTATDELQIGQNPGNINFTVDASGLVSIAETPAIALGWGLKVLGDDLIFYSKSAPNFGVLFAGGNGVYGPGVAGIAFGTMNTGTGLFTPTTPAPLQWTEYTGVFSAGGATSFAHGIAGLIKGAIVFAATASTGNVLWSNINTGGGHSLHITENAGSIIMSGSSTSLVPVGLSLQTQSYTLVVFHV